MKPWPTQTGTLALLLLTTIGLPAHAAERSPIYARLHGEVLLENSRVLVERFVLQPGESTGRHTHSSNQLLVFIKGGMLKSVRTGRSTLWRDGRVVWQSATDRKDEGVSQQMIEDETTRHRPRAARDGDRSAGECGYPRQYRDDRDHSIFARTEETGRTLRRGTWRRKSVQPRRGL